MREALPLERIIFGWWFYQTTLPGAPNLMQLQTGVTGLTPVVTVYRPDGAVLVTDVYATEQRNGLYTYQLNSEQVKYLGVFRAIATTTSTAVDCQTLTDIVKVTAGPVTISTGQIGQLYGQ